MSAPDAAPTQPEDRDGFIRLIHGRLNFEHRVVLVVDDEPALRTLLKREIKQAAPDVLVVEAEHGEEALEKLADIRRTFKVDPILIVLDLKMPGMDGWAVLDILRKEYEAAGETQGIPVIVQSSTSGEKRAGWHRVSVHGAQACYVPMVSVAKDSCLEAFKYDAAGRKDLIAWIRHFLHSG